MARGPRRRRAPLLIALALVTMACSTDAGVSNTTISTTSTRPTATSSTATSSTTTTTFPTRTTTTFGELPDIGARVKTPEGVGPFPAVVLVHGGGWVSGDPSIMAELADHLTEAGFLTVNIRYKLANESPGFPQAIDDVACAVRYAAIHPDSDGTVAIIGHSAGAHLSAVVALTGDLYAGDCPIPGSGVPDRFVGLAGPYDISRLGFLMIPFFGGGPNVFPTEWAAANPQLLTDENLELATLIMLGDQDGIVDSQFGADFHNALLASGSNSTIEVVEGARHMDMREAVWVGDLIVVWLER